MIEFFGGLFNQPDGTAAPATIAATSTALSCSSPAPADPDSQRPLGQSPRHA